MWRIRDDNAKKKSENSLFPTANEHFRNTVLLFFCVFHLLFLLALALLGNDSVSLRLDAVVLVTEHVATLLLHDVRVAVGKSIVSASDEVGKVLLVLGIDINDSESSSSLLVDHLAETSLALDDDVRDTLLTAESGEPADELDGVNVVSDDDLEE